MSKGSQHEAEFVGVVKLLSSEGQPISAQDICARTGYDRGVVYQVLVLCRTRRVAHFITINVGPGRAGHYLIGAVDRPRGEPAPQRFHFVEDLHRGWYNPLTGITGARLGVDCEP